MRLSNVLSVFMLASSGLSFVIPKDMAVAGIYSVERRGDGTDTFKMISRGKNAAVERRAEPEITENPAQILKRGSAGQIWCGCGFTLNPANCDAAVADVKTQFSKYLHFYSCR